MPKQNFIVVSNRLPITITKTDGVLSFNPSSGGLATAMSSVNKDNMIWVGWPGITDEQLTPSDKKKVVSELRKHNCVPVFLSSRQVEYFYEGYSNETIWPLFHYFHSLAQFNQEHWESYKEVNGLYSEAVETYASSESTIWIHDYHLMLLPQKLRTLLPNASIGFFLHIPFPSFEIFRLLPQRRAILKGLLGADLIGLHIYDYVRHLSSTVMRTLGVEVEHGQIQYKSRVIKVDAFPIGIDYQKFASAVTQKETADEIKLLDAHYPNQKLILSVDRLDYSKGIAHRLEAYEQFLSQHPEYHKKVTLIVIAVPSRTEVDAYKDLRDQIEQTVSRINGQYASIDWTPVSYQFQNQPFNKLVALYTRADIALVTPVRDGMNLVAKEFIASKQSRPGVLILSELTGAVDELPEALTINPNDKYSVVKAIEEALVMPLDQQKNDLKAMQRRIERYDVRQWAADFLEQLEGASKQQSMRSQKLLKPAEQIKLIERYKKSKKRQIILDYDGTLKSFVDSPKASHAAPSENLLKILSKISKQSGTEVSIISGRSREALDQWFGNLPIQLIAEHGYWIKRKGKWHNHDLDIADYKREALPIMMYYTDRTPGSILEDKTSSLVWHYRKVTPEMAYVRRRNLKHDLRQVLGNTEASVFSGNKILEVKPSHIHKGNVVKQLLKNVDYDFALCCGDDYTDEDMFSALHGNSAATSIKVGLGITQADYQIISVEQMIDLLKELV